MKDKDIEIVSTWGPTTKAMRQAVARVRKEFQRNASPGEYACRFYALKEIMTRYETCGEVVNRVMVTKVCRYYHVDAEERWARIIEQFGGPEQVSPEFQLDPTFLNPKFRS